MLVAFARYCVLLGCESVIHADFIPLFVIHVWPPRFPLNGIKKIQTHKRFKRDFFIRTKHNIRIFGIIPFVKLQNVTSTGHENDTAPPKTDKWLSFPSHFSSLVSPFNCCLSVVLQLDTRGLPRKFPCSILS